MPRDHHGRNNTTTEALRFATPMVVLPLFWDQHDKAQRLAEAGFGVRLDPCTCSQQALHSAIDTLSQDDALGVRLAELGRHVRARDGVGRAAALIESLGSGRRGDPDA